ncbi:zinc finger protein 845-like [Neodiprion fabricii]|uniref:zinc finger protein 845-like n=1 Tax=Neodiprion fabricii TaxID=2872261 RepID=UPI001ED93590|nr:zinc finger protein 845-like [Neodiprion fabricii]
MQHSLKYMCEECGLDLTRKTILRKHMKTHENTWSDSSTKSDCSYVNKTHRARAEMKSPRTILANMQNSMRLKLGGQSGGVLEMSRPSQISFHKDEEVSGEKCSSETLLAIKEEVVIDDDTANVTNESNNKNQICEFSTKHYPYLQVHFTRKHTDDYKYKCSSCKKQFKVETDYKVHMADHETGLFVCDFCGLTYSNKSSLYYHRNYKHTNKLKSFECKVCNKKLQSEKNLKIHLKQHEETKSHNHIRKAVKERLASEETNGEYQQQLLKNSQSNCEYTLTDCHRIMPSKNTLESSGILQKVPMRRGTKMRRTFKRRRLASIKDSNEIEGPTLRSCNVFTEEDAAGLLSRVKDETNVTNSKLSIKNSNKSYSEDIKPRGVLYKKLTDGNYTCDICHSTFEQKSKIMRHITSKHSFHRPFKCSICSKAFKYKCDLKAHKLIHETIDSSMLHRCDKCDYGTKTKNNLKSHYIRKHTDDYKFSCEHCGKRFKMEWDLKFHVGTHGSSQHMCDICGRFYTSSYSLYKHRKVAHLNDYKYQCNVCNKRLLTQENLDNHMLQHSQTYTCKECAKVFASKRYLSTHMTTHTGVKPYPCHVCEKNFRTSHMRNTHLLTHSAERPHICDLCGQAFKRRYYMIEHRRKHPDAHLSSPPVPLGSIRGNLGNIAPESSA